MFHEERKNLSDKTLNEKRAIDSLKEELDAVDWYQQRIDAVTNKELKKILEHNRDEEKEHAAMIIAWLKKNDSKFKEELNEYIDAEDIVKKESD